jgi:predicted DNA-binding protein (UPF0251 family)
MPRPHKCRNIDGSFAVSAFKPAGVPGRGLAVVELRLDELEAIRLADLEGFYQEQAAEKMGISRATFGRVLDSAHQKVADALLNGKMLTFTGGNVVMSDQRNFICGDCGHAFQVPFGTGRPSQCPSCSSVNIRRCLDEQNINGGAAGGFGPGQRRGRCQGGRGGQGGRGQGGQF